MTNFLQPVYTLHTPRGSNQSPMYERLPSTQTENFNAFGKQIILNTKLFIQMQKRIKLMDFQTLDQQQSHRHKIS